MSVDKATAKKPKKASKKENMNPEGETEETNDLVQNVSTIQGTSTAATTQSKASKGVRGKTAAIVHKKPVYSHRLSYSCTSKLFKIVFE